MLHSPLHHQKKDRGQNEEIVDEQVRIDQHRAQHQRGKTQSQRTGGMPRPACDQHHCDGTQYIEDQRGFRPGKDQRPKGTQRVHLRVGDAWFQTGRHLGRCMSVLAYSRITAVPKYAHAKPNCATLPAMIPASIFQAQLPSRITTTPRKNCGLKTNVPNAKPASQPFPERKAKNAATKHRRTRPESCPLITKWKSGGKASSSGRNTPRIACKPGQASQIPRQHNAYARTLIATQRHAATRKGIRLNGEKKRPTCGP